MTLLKFRHRFIFIETSDKIDVTVEMGLILKSKLIYFVSKIITCCDYDFTL